MRKYITVEQAISILPEGENVHTFRNAPMMLIGADWSRADIIKEINKREILELTGEQAAKMGHGFCLYDKSTKYQGVILFVETNPEALAKLEAELAAAQNEPT